MRCFECGKQAKENHHVVPEARGGTKTVPLCSRCHNLAHGFNGIETRPRGRPPGYPPEVEAYAMKLLRQPGMNPSLVAHRFNAEGIPCLGKRWRASSFQRMIERNERARKKHPRP
jgi:hypothetical protein